MTLVYWAPVDYRPLILFLLEIGLVSLAYAWVVATAATLIGSAGKAVRIPFDIGLILKVTVGHAVLALAAILTIYAGQRISSESVVLYTCIAAIFVWMTLAPELYEEYARSPNEQEQHSRPIFWLRFVLIILWTAAVATANVTPFVVLYRELLTGTLVFSAIEFFDWMFLLPYFIGMVLGALGAYSLFRSVFKALFATFGLLGEFRSSP